uniref:Uncharacterized protein n=1 Tax=Caenorhabditis japonica TaxID=281687 RepID=A0A8R1IJQ2_CAEJA
MTVVEERPDIAKLRVEYLNKKKELDDENAFFAAFDETWVHDGMAPTSGWQHQNTTMYKKARMGLLIAIYRRSSACQSEWTHF